MKLHRKTYAKIYLDNIKYNVEKIIKDYSYEYYIGVVKADSYGHKGIKPIKAMISSGINYLAVVSLEEALHIRRYLKDIPILCMGVVHYEDVELAIKNNITLTINSLETTKDYLKVNNTGLKVHIKINTGANRLGIKEDSELVETLDLLSKNNITVEGIYTHVYNADNKTDTENQFRSFEETTKNIDLYKIPIRHLQASNAMCNYEKPKYVNASRFGIIMYGLANPAHNLKSTISLHSQIIQINHLKKGDNVGYKGVYHAPNDEIIGVVCIGYADGIIRKNKGRFVYVNDKPYPIIGNICMDYLFIRIDESVKLYDDVVIIKDNDHVIEIAEYLDTIPYEVINSITTRVPRIYK